MGKLGYKLDEIFTYLYKSSLQHYNIIILIPPTITIVANRCHNQHHNSATATIFIATHCHHHYSYTLSSPLPSTFVTTTTIITKSLPQ